MAKLNLSDVNNLQNEPTAVAAINNNSRLITEAVENTISRDGTQPNMMNSVLDMNSNRIINLPDGVSDQEAVTYGQFLEGITSVANGAVIDGPFVTVVDDPTLLNNRNLTASSNLIVVDNGPKNNIDISISDPELNALAATDSSEDMVPYYTGVGTADVTSLTPYARTLIDDIDSSTARETLEVVIGTDVQAHDNTLDSLSSSSSGMIAKTAPGDITPRTITGTANEITLTNGNGVFGDPTVSLPSSLTFTGKTITGGTYNSPSISTPTGITKSDVGLSNVDNTSDATKNSATATLTNKSISGSSNTITNLPTTSISNSAVTNAKLATMSDATIKSNISGSTANPSDNTVTAILDKAFGNTQGSVIYRGASSWSSLAPGTTNYFLQTKGTGNNPTWTNVPGGGDLLSTNNLSDLASAPTALTNLGGTTTGKALFTATGESDVLATIPSAYTKNNILGTVSQSSGVPTGAIIESGSNSNGYYIKYANGTMICYKTLGTSVSRTISFGLGALYGLNTGGTYTFAATFASTPSLNISINVASSGARCYPVITILSTSSFTFDLLNPQSGTYSIQESYIAIGRWY